MEKNIIIKDIVETIQISNILNETLDNQGNQLEKCNKIQKQINDNQIESKIILRKMNSYLWSIYYKIIKIGTNMIDYTTKNIKDSNKLINNNVKDSDKLINNNVDHTKESEEIINKLNILYNNSIIMSDQLDKQLLLLDEQNNQSNKNEYSIINNNKKINKIIKK